MRPTPLRLAALAVLAGALLLPGCGGHTGLEVVIQMPPSAVPGTNFDSLYVKVQADGGINPVGDPYPISRLTPTPYVVYVYADQTKHYECAITVQVWQGNAIKCSAVVSNVVIEQGSMKKVTADLSTCRID